MVPDLTDPESLRNRPVLRYMAVMNARLASFDVKTRQAEEASSPLYREWKRVKIECALQQSQDRAAMIDADDVWRDLGLEA